MTIDEILAYAAKGNDVERLVVDAVAALPGNRVIAAHMRIQSLSKAIKKLEAELRDKVVSEVFSVKKTQLCRETLSKNILISNDKIKIKLTLDYRVSVDKSVGEFATELAKLGDKVKEETTYSITSKRYEELDAENKSFLQDFVTLKPASPTITYT